MPEEQELQELIKKHADNIQEYAQSADVNSSVEAYALLTAVGINFSYGIAATKNIGADELADMVVDEMLIRLSKHGYEFQRVEVSDGHG